MIVAVWRAAGPRRARLARGVLWRFLQAASLGLAFGTVIWVVDRIRDGGETWPAVVMVALSLAGQLLFGYLSVTDSWLASYDLVGDLRLNALDHLRRLPLGFHLGRRQGETVTAFTSDLQAVETFASDGLPRIAQATGLPLIVLAFLASVDPLLAAAAAISVVAAVPVYLWTNRRFAALALRRQDQQAVATAGMIEYVQGIAVIRAFNQTTEGQERFRRSLDDFRDLSIRMLHALIPLALAFAAVAQLGIPLVIAAVGYRLAGGELGIGAAVAFLVLCPGVYQPLLQLLAVMEDTRLAAASLTRIGRVLDTPVQAEPASPRTPEGAGIEFREVRFGYGDEAVLDGVSFQVPERSMTALVGPSGAGKTTVLSLVARFFDVWSGAVLVGGVDVREMTTESLYSRLSVVFQDVYLFQGTIFDNIAFGRPDATAEEVEAAARAAQAHDFVTALPDGYATRVGEGGATLSGGERQRISIARAVLKDAPVVLLDEATAAVDPTNERLVAEALRNLVADKTLLVVAHKLTTVRAADQILVLDEGRITERGTHDELLAADGTYARLWGRMRQTHNWSLTGKTPA